MISVPLPAFGYLPLEAGLRETRKREKIHFQALQVLPAHDRLPGYRGGPAGEAPKTGKQKFFHCIRSLRLCDPVDNMPGKCAADRPQHPKSAFVQASIRGTQVAGSLYQSQLKKTKLDFHRQNADNIIDDFQTILFAQFG